MSDILFGIHTVSTLIMHQPNQVRMLYLARGENKRLAQLAKQAEESNIRQRKVSGHQLDELCGGQNHQGVVVEVSPFQVKGEKELLAWSEKMPPQACMLILDTVQDPHNLGACIRSAEALGIHGIIIPQAKSAQVTPVVRKVACGAELGIDIYQVANLARSLDHLKAAGMWLYGTAIEAQQRLDQLDLRGPIGIVMGNEKSGIRPLTQKKCDVLVSIPLRGMTQSLNVSVATGICLYEVCKQRLD